MALLPHNQRPDAQLGAAVNDIAVQKGGDEFDPFFLQDTSNKICTVHGRASGKVTLFPVQSALNFFLTRVIFLCLRAYFCNSAPVMPRKYLIYLAPQFSMMSLLPLTEALRKANELAEEPLYSYEFVSSGNQVDAVNGMSIRTGNHLPRDKTLAGVIICASYQLQIDDEKAVQGWLRWCARHGLLIGVTDIGAFLAARAGTEWPGSGLATRHSLDMSPTVS